MIQHHIWIELFDLTGCDRQAWRTWYDESFLAPRARRPGVTLARRGSGVADLLVPAASNEGLEIAVYEVADPALILDWTNEEVPKGDAAIDRAFRAGSRRSYRQLSSTLEPYEPPVAEILHGGFFEVPAEHHAEFNAWYDQEHIADQQRVPGYLSVRRFQGEPEHDRFVALYDVATLASTRSAEAAAALTSPWGDRVRTTLVTSRARRLFRVERLERGITVGGQPRGR
jgi:hypothetical protein